MIPTWFDVARFGLFFHWGHSSQRGVELSWPMVGGNFALPHCEDIPVGEYQSTAATFDPQKFDAREWARLAKETRAEYAVFTAKHHDGYSMFHTKFSDFSIENSPFGRDIVREWVGAFRDEGLRIGLYFSLIDWHHPDYPAFTDAHRPYNFANLPRPKPEQWERYLEFMFWQVRELLTNYGRIDLIWFDGQWERTPEQWRAVELAAMIRELQPEIVINDRLPGGDYDTPEQFVPAQPPARPWEVCLTMNESWGYNPDDPDYKSSRRLVQTLCEIAGKGGRLLLNLGPRGDGTLATEQLDRVHEVGAWMRCNGESIAGTSPGLEPWQFLRAVDAKRADAVPSPADATVRRDHGARSAHSACEVGARAFVGDAAIFFRSLQRDRSAAELGPAGRADDRGAGVIARPAGDGARGRDRAARLAAHYAGLHARSSLMFCASAISCRSRQAVCAWLTSGPTLASKSLMTAFASSPVSAAST